MKNIVDFFSAKNNKHIRIVKYLSVLNKTYRQSKHNDNDDNVQDNTCNSANMC